MGGDGAFSSLPRLIPQVYFDYLERLNSRATDSADFLPAEARTAPRRLSQVMELEPDFKPKFVPAAAVRPA